jgi:hypothetical protein
MNHTALIKSLEPLIPDMFINETCLESDDYAKQLDHANQMIQSSDSISTRTLVCMNTQTLSHGGEENYSELLATLVYTAILGALSCNNQYISSTGTLATLSEQLDQNIHELIKTAYIVDYELSNIADLIQTMETVPEQILVLTDTNSHNDQVDKTLFKDIDNIRIEPIPQKILETYKEIIKKHIMNITQKMKI